MAVEIERKFLVADDRWRETVTHSVPMVQGYLARGSDITVRVRLAGELALLTIKGRSNGLSRPEFEYPIPPSDAHDLLALSPIPLIEKVRHLVPAGPHTFEVDVFTGANAGLVVAEVELRSEDEAFQRPPWLGREVSDDPRYGNASLARNPWSSWGVGAL